MVQVPHPLFRPIVPDSGPGQSLNNMIDAVLDHCRVQLLFDDLLRAIHRTNPREYARFAPFLGAPASSWPVSKERT